MNKPHIIIINPDEMRCDSMGHMGNSAASTPNLDQFAETDAVSFRNAYCQNPVCVPSRCSFMTGLYPHTRGHRTMQYLLHEDESTLFKELKDSGYHVWMNARNDLLAAQIPGLVASHASEIYYGEETESPEKKANGNGANKRQGSLHGGENGFPFSHYRGHNRTGEDQDMLDTCAAIKRIRTPIPDGKPLCLFLGWVNPHPPYYVEETYYDRIDESKLSQRVSLDETSGKAKILHEIKKYAGMEGYTEAQWTELRKVYLAQCAKVDEMFGMICDALKEEGMYDDSAIFVLSDHGDFTGDYSLPEKAQNTFEDCLTKVPLLIKPPKGIPVDPGITNSLAELVDFYATVMDFAGEKPVQDHFGRSLRSVVADRSINIREYVCCEGGRLPHEIQADEAHVESADGNPAKNEYWPKIMAQKDALAHEKGTMIFDGRYKYVERPSGFNELYDLTEDSKERFNIYPQHKDSQVVLDFQRKLLNWYQTTCDVVPKKYDSRMTSEKLWEIIKNMIPDENKPALKQYMMQNPGITIWKLMDMMNPNGASQRKN